MDKMYKSATQGKSNSSNIAGYIKIQLKIQKSAPDNYLPAGRQGWD